MIRKTQTNFTRMTINSALKDSPHPELPVFYAYAFQKGLEVALTEYAARICYNSVGKLGSSENFVTKVLGHGHLSVAEHSSIALGKGLFGVSKKLTINNLFQVSRFFDVSPNFLFGNMRFWLEYLAKVPYRPEFEIFLSTFPVAFKDQALMPHFDTEYYPQVAPIFVPGGGGVDLIAVNFGDILKNWGKNPETDGDVGRFTWLIEDISRACSHHIARHRGASISEQSMRYVDARKLGPQFVYPPDATDSQLLDMQEQNEAGFAKYVKLRESGMKAEDARLVLPLATKTRMVLSFNWKELLHFFNVRCAKDAQWEVRSVARKMAWQAWLATGSEKLQGIMEKHGIEQWEG